MNSFTERLRKRFFGKWLNKIALVLSVGLVSFTATGCWDRQELEQQAFVTVLGIDKAPNGLVDCTVSLALPNNPASGGGGGNKSSLSGSSPMTFRAHNVTEALSLANASVERTLALSHLSAIVIGEDVARDGITSQLQPLVRYREFRRTVFIGVTKGTAKELMQLNKPVLEASSGRIAADIAEVGGRNGMTLVVRLHQLLSALETPHQDPVLPLYSVNDQVKQDPKGKQGLSETAVKYNAGQVNRSGGNPVEWMGAAVFQGDRLVGFLTGPEVAYFRVLQGTLRSTRMSFSDPKGRYENVDLAIRMERQPQYNIALTNPLKISIDVPLDTELVSSGGQKDWSLTGNRVQLENMLNQRMSADMTALVNKLTKDYKVDGIPISNHIRHLFSTDAEFVRYPWEEKLQNAQVDVHAHVQLRRFGIQNVPLQTKN